MSESKTVDRAKFAVQGRNLTLALRARGITKWRMAKDLGISYRTIQYWEKGQTLPSDELFERVADYLGLAKPEAQHENELTVELADIKARLCIIEKHLGIS